MLSIYVAWENVVVFYILTKGIISCWTQRRNPHLDIGSSDLQTPTVVVAQHNAKTKHSVEHKTENEQNTYSTKHKTLKAQRSERNWQRKKQDTKNKKTIYKTENEEPRNIMLKAKHKIARVQIGRQNA